MTEIVVRKLVEQAEDGIWKGFVWSTAPQGFDYWNEVWYALRGIINEKYVTQPRKDSFEIEGWDFF